MRVASRAATLQSAGLNLQSRTSLLIERCLICNFCLGCLFRRQDECAVKEKGALWSSMSGELAFCLAIEWGRVFRRAECFKLYKQTCELGGLINVQSSWWRVAVLPLLMCWRVDSVGLRDGGG